MKRLWKRLFVCVLAAAVVLTALPLGVNGAALADETVIGYGRAAVDSVNVRKLADRSADAWFQIDRGYVCQVLGTRQSNGESWYKVRCEKPQSSSHNVYVGYVLTKSMTLMTDAECEEWLKNPVQPDGDMAITGGMATGQITSGDVNVREKPSITASSMFKLDRGVVVQLLSIPAAGSSDPWYQIKYNGHVGYVKGEFIKVLSTGSLSGTSSDSQQPAVNTPAGYVKTTLTKVNVRSAVGGSTLVQIPQKDTVLPYYVTATEGGQLYYYVGYAGYTGYISGQYVTPCDIQGNLPGSQTGATATPVPVATPVPTPIPTTALGYVKTTSTGGVNVRSEVGGSNNVVTSISGKNVVVPYYATAYDGGVLWYYVSANGLRGWAHGNYLAVCKADGSNVSAASSTEKPSQSGDYGYVRTTMVKVRIFDENGKMIGRIEPKDVVLPITGPTRTTGSYLWYPITYNGLSGYLRYDPTSPSCEKLSAQTQPTAAPTAAPTPAPTNKPAEPTVKPGVEGYGYVRTTMVKVRIFDENGKMIGRIEPKDVVLPILGNVRNDGTYLWYPVKYGTVSGYLRYDAKSPSCQKLTPLQEQAYLLGLPIPDDNSTPAPTAKPTATPVPTAPPVPTAAPTGKPTSVPGLSQYGYARTTMVKVRLWKAPAKNPVMVERIENKGTVVPLTGNAVYQEGYTWYPVQYGNTRGYLRVDAASPNSEKLTAAQELAYLQGQNIPPVNATPTPPPAQSSSFVVTILNDVNLRVSADKLSESVAKYNAGKVLAYNASITSGGVSWYRVIDNNRSLYVLASSVRVMTQTEYQQYIAANPQNTPQTEIVLGYVKTTMNSVNVRQEPKSGAKILGKVDSGKVYAYSAVEKSGGYNYYLVNTAVGKGYIRDTALALCDANGVVNPVMTPSPTVMPPVVEQYPVLRLGSTGEAVTRLVTELKKQGFYVGEVTNTYTSAVRSAVIAFQRSKGLGTDGVAGQQTQTALYNTVVDNGDSTVVDGMTIYPAEKIDWYTGGIQQLWAKGASYKVYDVYTGIVWTARYHNGARHADVEPLTKADTAKLCKIYGVSKASDINSKDHWHRRPCLVTIGNRTFACSLYGVPHGDNDGAIKDNDMYGVLCIHFANSEIHASGDVDPNHQEAIEYAYQHAPNGHK